MGRRLVRAGYLDSARMGLSRAPAGRQGEGRPFRRLRPRPLGLP